MLQREESGRKLLWKLLDYCLRYRSQSAHFDINHNDTFVLPPQNVGVIDLQHVVGHVCMQLEHDFGGARRYVHGSMQGKTVSEVIRPFGSVGRNTLHSPSTASHIPAGNSVIADGVIEPGVSELQNNNNWKQKTSPNDSILSHSNGTNAPGYVANSTESPSTSGPAVHNSTVVDGVHRDENHGLMHRENWLQHQQAFTSPGIQHHEPPASHSTVSDTLSSSPKEKRRGISDRNANVQLPHASNDTSLQSLKLQERLRTAQAAFASIKETTKKTIS